MRARDRYQHNYVTYLRCNMSRNVVLFVFVIAIKEANTPFENVDDWQIFVKPIELL